jgi:predicted DNA-binding transcriptional regulator AlpA
MYKKGCQSTISEFTFSGTMRMSQVAQKTGFSRQWISRMAANGEVPDAVRTKAGRWRFKDSPEFMDWVARMGRWSQIRYRKRFLHQDEAELRRLEKKLAKIRVTAESRANKKRVTELTQLISERRAALSDVMTTEQVAAAVKRSRRWVTNMAPEIPGAHFSKNRHLFQKSNALAAWIRAERRISELDRKMFAGNRRWRRSSTFSAFHALLRCQRDIRRCLIFNPFEDWEPGAQKAFVRDFNSMVKGIEQAIQQ